MEVEFYWNFRTNLLKVIHQNACYLKEDEFARPGNENDQDWEIAMNTIIVLSELLLINYSKPFMTRCENQCLTEQLFEVLGKWLWYMWV